MKKIIWILIFSIVSVVLRAQTVFDKFDGREGITSVVVNKKMFQMMASVNVGTTDKETQNYLNLIRKLDNLKVFTTSNPRISSEMKSTAENYSQTVSLDAMLKRNENGNNIKVWVKTGGAENNIKELLLFREESKEDNRAVLMSLTGDFNWDDVAILSDKMKIPTNFDLKNVGKEK
jgi:hypothetical protein